MKIFILWKNRWICRSRRCFSFFEGYDRYKRKKPSLMYREWRMPDAFFDRRADICPIQKIPFCYKKSSKITESYKEKQKNSEAG